MHVSILIQSFFSLLCRSVLPELILLSPPPSSYSHAGLLLPGANAFRRPAGRTEAALLTIVRPRQKYDREARGIAFNAIINTRTMITVWMLSGMAGIFNSPSHS